MIKTKAMVLCFAVLAFVAKSNEIHYHYHMDGQQSPKFDHKGYKLCATGAYTKHSGCMTLALFSAAKRQACRNSLAARLNACRIQNPNGRLLPGYRRPKGKRLLPGSFRRPKGKRNLRVPPALIMRPYKGKRLLPGSFKRPKKGKRLLDVNNYKHKGISSSFCNFKASFLQKICRAKAKFGNANDNEKNQKLADCDAKYQAKVATCNGQRVLAQLERKATNPEQHLLFCKQRAEFVKFWCNLKASLRGGDQKEAKLAACSNSYNTSVENCHANNQSAAPVNNNAAPAPVNSSPIPDSNANANPQ